MYQSQTSASSTTVPGIPPHVGLLRGVLGDAVVAPNWFSDEVRRLCGFSAPGFDCTAAVETDASC